MLTQIKKVRGRNKGFTLFELLITIGIVTIIMGIVLFNQSKFRTDIDISNVAYKLALTIREAQVYSISVRQFGSAQNFDVPYGVHFNKEVPDGFILFADFDRNGLYNYPDYVEGAPAENNEDMVCETGGDSECIEKIVLGRGNEITGWCGIWLGLGSPDEQNCFSGDVSGGGPDYGYLDIQFKRPNPDALFEAFETENYDPTGNSIEACLDNDSDPVACTGWAICLSSPQGKKKEVIVYETGQISVGDTDDDSSCPE